MVTIWRTFLLWVFMASSLSGPAWALEIEATVGRLELGLAESLQVQLKILGNAKVEPDYAPLRHDWEIIEITEATRSRSAGEKTMIRKLTVQPKSAGQKIIPALCIGQACSQPIAVEVRSGSTLKFPVEQQIILETEVDPQKIMLKSKAQLNIRLWLRAKYPVGELSEPEVDESAARIVKLRSPLLRVATRSDGLAYQLVVRHYEIYPQKAGILEIPPLFYKGRVVGAQTRFDPFKKNGMLVQVKSAPLQLEVSDLPENTDPGDIPSATNILIEDDWSARLPEFVVGKTVTRTLRLIAEGFTADKLPEFEFEVPADFKIYADRAQRFDGQGGRKVLEQTFRLIPVRPGKFLLPAVTLDWWDTGAGELRREALPARQIVVLPAAKPERAAQEGSEMPAAPTSKVVPKESGAPVGQGQGGSSDFWPWLSLGLALGWLLTLIVVARFRTRLCKKRQVRPTERDSEQKCRQAVIRAARRDDSVATRQALVDWGKFLCRDELGNGYEQLYAMIPPALRREMELLDKVLYGTSREKWKGSGLASAAAGWRTQSKKDKHDDLPDLYPSG